jgi:hypothetical protein
MAGEGRSSSIMAIYSKFGDKMSDIRITRECYAGGKLIQVVGLIEGQTNPRLHYISDLRADGGEQEKKTAIAAALKAIDSDVH